MEYVPNYMCEACTGRAVLGRELGESDEDVSILLLEHMRMMKLQTYGPKALSAVIPMSSAASGNSRNSSTSRSSRPRNSWHPLCHQPSLYNRPISITPCTPPRAAKTRGTGYPRTAPGSCAAQHPTLLTSTSKSRSLAKSSKTTDAQSWLST